MDGIFVTNTNDFPHYDRYDGEDFQFLPGDKVFIPKDAATHLFGWNMPDKTECLVRLGWASKYDQSVKNYVDDPEGVRKLAGFVFDEAVMVAKSSLAQKLDAEAA
jgi:hypothetical protein